MRLLHDDAAAGPVLQSQGRRLAPSGRQVRVSSQLAPPPASSTHTGACVRRYEPGLPENDGILQQRLRLLKRQPDVDSLSAFVLSRLVLLDLRISVTPVNAQRALHCLQGRPILHATRRDKFDFLGTVPMITPDGVTVFGDIEVDLEDNSLRVGAMSVQRMLALIDVVAVHCEDENVKFGACTLTHSPNFEADVLDSADVEVICGVAERLLGSRPTVLRADASGDRVCSYCHRAPSKLLGCGRCKRCASAARLTRRSLTVRGSPACVQGQVLQPQVPARPLESTRRSAPRPRPTRRQRKRPRRHRTRSLLAARRRIRSARSPSSTDSAAERNVHVNAVRRRCKVPSVRRPERTLARQKRAAR